MENGKSNWSLVISLVISRTNFFLMFQYKTFQPLINAHVTNAAIHEKRIENDFPIAKSRVINEITSVRFR